LRVKAVVLRAFGSVDNFELAEVPLPAVRDGDVRIRVEAASFNPVDAQIRKGAPESRDAGSMILGRDLSGRVESVGRGVSTLAVGDEVFSNVCRLASSGTYAEYVSVPAELVARKPALLTHAQAAAVPVAATTASLALERARAGADTSLFVAGGAGGVGTFAILLARRLGVRRLVTTAGNAKSHAHLIEYCGLRGDQIVDYRSGAFVAEALARNGGGFDIVLDLVGGRMLTACCSLLGIDSHLASATEAPSRDDFEELFRRNASFHAVGANVYSLADDRATWSGHRLLLDRLASDFDGGALPAPRVTVLGTLSVPVVQQAHLLLDAGGVQGKLVMQA
jgi:NADPH2:quinone reductase